MHLEFFCPQGGNTGPNCCFKVGKEKDEMEQQIPALTRICVTGLKVTCTSSLNKYKFILSVIISEEK